MISYSFIASHSFSFAVYLPALTIFFVGDRVRPSLGIASLTLNIKEGPPRHLRPFLVTLCLCTYEYLCQNVPHLPQHAEECGGIAVEVDPIWTGADPDPASSSSFKPCGITERERDWAASPTAFLRTCWEIRKNNDRPQMADGRADGRLGWRTRLACGSLPKLQWGINTDTARTSIGGRSENRRRSSAGRPARSPECGRPKVTPSLLSG